MTTVLLALLLTIISYKLITRGVISWYSESEEANQHKLGEEREPLLDNQQDGSTDDISGEFQPYQQIWTLTCPSSNACCISAHVIDYLLYLLCWAPLL